MSISPGVHPATASPPPATPPDTGRRAIVLGGGLAGIAAALRLSEAGWRIVLVESRQRLGGRATSHIEPQTGQAIDNCQHVLLGCCTNLIDLYDRLGVAHLIEWHSDLHFADRLGRHDVLSASPWPAPLHLAPAMLGFSSLSWRSKWAIARAMLALMRLRPDEIETWTGRSFASWLAQHGQPPEAIERFWNVILVTALNETPAAASATYAMQVFHQGFLAHRDAYRMGVARVPLVQLYDPAKRLLEGRGGEVWLSASVRSLRFDGRSVTGVELADGRTLSADACVSALPFDRLLSIVPASLRAADPRLAPLERLRVSPILGIHLWFSREVLQLPHLIFLDSPLQWVFNHGVDPSTGRQHLHAVISAAHDWVDLPAEAILQRVRNELAVYVPSATTEAFASGRVIKERRATFSPAPGVDELRPPACGPVPNLLLAGDFCQSGWPATMEGAVRSGYLAASALCGQNLLAPDLPVAWPLRGLGFGKCDKDFASCASACRPGNL